VLSIERLIQQGQQLRPDPSRVLLRSFRPSTEPRDLKPTDKTRANHIVERVLALDADAAERELARAIENFDVRHRDLLAKCEQRAQEMDEAFALHPAFSTIQRQLIGAYFLHEYSFQAAALFNPSVVTDPDQGGLVHGEHRFIVSLRAVGEGHISSLTFCTGIVDDNGQVRINTPARLASLPTIDERSDGVHGESVRLHFDGDFEIEERVIFPLTASQAHGIEDARFVEFNDDGARTYYATYTAYSGQDIRSELIETKDFVSFLMSPLAGSAARNKGMALFPRKINGHYAMIGRQDNENLYLIESDDLYTWNGGKVILEPAFPWEFVQIGNCGSPIELDEGWLLLTHGVGAMRRYAIGAALLDKADPSKVIARLREPLIEPLPAEREGYVPNVVYSCGAMRYKDFILLPYATSDTLTHFATIKIAALLEAMSPPSSW
jgi:predicted GH43/DUF377 family glycosyl hydrolase